ncbi:hypothetical protein BDZ45DRAFT_747327 [Acephala macrosclerotiorum]|nr:hypothetical protein BDZ45DRAFT_747327 [Acephala macrosclerotiorum]
MHRPEFVKTWILALNPSNTKETTRTILKDLLAGYVACTDSPSYMFVEELTEGFPDAKVIVTTRDPEKWRKRSKGWRMGYEEEKGADGARFRRKNFWKRTMSISGEPYKERLFFDVKEGWGPLCKILNVPVPDEPFPPASDRLAVEQAFKSMIKEAFVR